MTETQKFLDPNSELIALSTFGNTKNVFVIAMEIEGPFDENMFRQSVAGTVELYPQFRCRLREIINNGRRRLYWHPVSDFQFPVSISDLKGYDPSRPVLETILEHLSPRLDREWDLFSEGPGEAHLLRISGDHYVVVSLIHHAVVDAVTAAEIGRQFFLKYKELMTGVKDDLQGVTTNSVSTSRKRAAKVKKFEWQDFVHNVRLALSPLFSKPQLPVGSGTAGDKNQRQIKRVLSEEDTARLTMTAQKSGGVFIDILVASTNMAIERWNSIRNVQTGTVTTTVTMSIKGRYENLDHSNNVSAIFFESTPQERKDSKKFLRSLAVSRIGQFRKQMDLRNYENVSRMITFLSFLPFRLRRRVTHHIIQKHKWSIGITLLGVMWPEMKNGKPTIDSYPLCVNETQITEVYGTGYKTMTDTPLLLIVYFFRRRINLILTAKGSLFTQAEADAFLDLLIDTLKKGLNS